MTDWYPEVLKLRGHVTALETENRQLQAKLDAVINAVYDGCDCDCRGYINKALQERDDKEEQST